MATRRPKTEKIKCNKCGEEHVLNAAQLQKARGAGSAAAIKCRGCGERVQISGGTDAFGTVGIGESVRITASRLRRIIREEVQNVLDEAPTGKQLAAAPDTNARKILRALAANGPMTKSEIIQRMGKKAGPFAKGDYNISAYFAQVSPFSKAAGSNLSLVSSGHVEVVGREGREIVYGLTELGEEEAGM